MDNLYPNYWKKENGEIMMLKSCLPYKKKVQELFPWNRIHQDLLYLGQIN